MRTRKRGERPGRVVMALFYQYGGYRHDDEKLRFAAM